MDNTTRVGVKMPRMRPIEQACYWYSTVQGLQPSPPLQGDVECQIAIVGAGFTGLWTAHFLKSLQPNLDIAVIEQGVAGYGASGRNAGIVSPCLDHSHALAIAHFGREEAGRLARIGLDNIKELGEYAHDCDFEATGVLYVSLKPEHNDAYKDTADTAEELGIGGHHLLDAEQTRAELNSPLYVGGLQIDDGGIINPFKLVSKLKRELQAAGVRFFENSKVTGVSEGTVTVDGGTIKAEKVILATDAYTHHLLPQLLPRFIPLYDYILVSEPLSPEELSSLHWRRRQGVTDGRTFFNYYRLTADNCVLWGTSEAVYYPSNRVDTGCDHSQQHYDELQASFARHFPQLKHVRFPYGWGGPIASTTRLTPFFGTTHKGRTLYALGYTGHGIGTTRIAGKILAHMALSRPSELLQLKMVCNQPFPYPPEPLRGLAVNAVTRSLQAVDAGHRPNLLLKMLDAFGIGFSS
jgi:glycine/D-amino acid oxidase-like deaminating enzyme